MNDIRNRIETLTATAKAQSDLDAFVSRGELKALLAEFPGRADEVMYEWDSRKLHFRKTTRGDDDGY